MRYCTNAALIWSSAKLTIWPTFCDTCGGKHMGTREVLRVIQKCVRLMLWWSPGHQEGSCASANVPLVSLVCAGYTCTKALLPDWTLVFPDTPNPPNLSGIFPRIAYSDNTFVFFFCVKGLSKYYVSYRRGGSLHTSKVEYMDKNIYFQPSHKSVRCVGQEDGSGGGGGCGNTSCQPHLGCRGRKAKIIGV